MTDDPDDRHAWERPGAVEVAPGVHRIPLPLPNDGLRAVNVYAIADGDRVVLIDAGWALAGVSEKLDTALRSVGYGLGAVSDFLVTHVHRDHYTQAVVVRREVGGRISLGEGERVALEAIRSAPERPDHSDLLRAGADPIVRELGDWRPDTDLSVWELPDRWLADRVELPLTTRTLHVIATPGHTSGHVVFHDPDHGALFAGDHVLPHITPSIGVQPVRAASPLRDYLASLQLVRALPDARLLPAHGPVTDSVHARIDELLSHHAVRLDDTAAAVAHGASTAYDTARALGWTRRLRSFDDLDLFNRILAVRETAAHLTVLVEQGRLRADDVDGVRRFSVA
jgi:glyoxylase-like metal-dependent hydrolase (beta-lactamase superfamily II)